MNKISLKGAVWLASDIHLGPQTPATRHAFHTFLNEASAQADALVLCGDIFDTWVGDDLALSGPPQWLADTLAKLKEVAGTIPLWLGRGNRDFLMGPQLCQYLGAQLLPEAASRLITDYGDVLLSHGDEYCMSDAGYQRFRRIVRNRWVQRLFLSLSLNQRRKIADYARNRSMVANRHKAAAIMDVTPAAVEKAFSTSGITTMVHGHTHRPAVHFLRVGAQTCKRIVLPDWDFDHDGAARGGWLVIDQHGMNLQSATRV